MILKQVQVFHIRCVTLSVAFNHPFCFHVLLYMWTLERAEQSLVSQNTYDVSVILVLSKHEVILCGTKSGTLSVWSICSLLEGLSEKRNCSRMLSNCSEGMKNCDNGSAYLQTLDTCFLKNLQYHRTRWRSSKIEAPKQSGNRTICKTANRFWIAAFCW